MLPQYCWRRTAHTYNYIRVYQHYGHEALAPIGHQCRFIRDPRRFVSNHAEPTFIRRNPKKKIPVANIEIESFEHNGAINAVKEPKKRERPKQTSREGGPSRTGSKDTGTTRIEDEPGDSEALVQDQNSSADEDSTVIPKTKPTAQPTPNITTLTSPPTNNPHSISKPSSSREPSITPGSKHHHDLPTFLLYASRTHLPRTSTVYTGTHYEYTVAASLTRLGFTLTRTGSRSDLGIDLLGTWTVPSAPSPIRVFVQCKALASGLFPQHARELMGAFAGLPKGWDEEGVLGLVASPADVTRGVREAVGRAGRPVGFLKVSREGRVEEFHWNRRAGEGGLRGVGVTLRYGGGEGEGGSQGPEVCLISDGWPVDFGGAEKTGARDVEEQSSEADKTS